MPRVVVLVLVLTASCGSCQRDANPTSNAAETGRLFDELLGDLPEARAQTPQAALPEGLDWAMASPDPRAYLDWARQQPLVQRFEKTALYAEILAHPRLAALEQWHRRVTQAAALTGSKADSFWRGPIAIGSGGDADSGFIAIKTVSVQERALVQLAGAFARLVGRATAGQGPQLKTEAVDGQPMHTFVARNHPIVFSLFNNLLIVGDDSTLVRSAIQQALTTTTNTDRAFGRDWGTRAGVHIGMSFAPTDVGPLLGWPAVMMSLSPDTAEPIQIRRLNNDRPTLRPPTRLSRYVSKSAILAFADGGWFPLDGYKTLVRRAPFLGQRRATGGLDLAEAIFSKLSPGAVVSVGSLEETLDLRIVFGHSDPTALDAPLRQLARAWTKGRVSRIKTVDGEVIIRIQDGPAFALTEDALIFGLSEAQARQALAAGRGVSPSLHDRAAWPKDAAGGALIDFTQAGPLLSAFYTQALVEDSAAWSEVSDDLRETFDTLATAGIVAGPFVHGPRGFEATLRVHP